MHIRIRERRLAVTLEKHEDIDDQIKRVAASIARNIRITSSFTLGEGDAREIERKIHIEVNKVTSIPLTSDQGAGLRQNLIQRLTNINKYVGHLSIKEENNATKEIEIMGFRYNY